MQFKDISARSNWRERASNLGYLSTVFDNHQYWIESLDQPFCAVFSPSDIDEIERATRELNELALVVVDRVCSSSSDHYFEQLRIPPAFRNAVRASWKRRDRALYGRFDFAFSEGTLKLLELNFDTPTSLYEASVFQWMWLDDLLGSGVLPERADQYNSINELLIKWFGSSDFLRDGILHLASMSNFPEDEDTVRYLQSCATLAGIETQFVHMLDIGVDETGMWFDLDDKPIRSLFKLYPWEFLIEENDRNAPTTEAIRLPALVEQQLVHFIEPCWKSILSNKAVLPLLWEEAPGHRYLVESTFDDDSAAACKIRQTPHVRKPIFGREGDSVSVIDPYDPSNCLTKSGIYGAEGFVLQSLCQLARYRDYHLVTGSWLVENDPAGVGLRADTSRVTGNMAHFVPHCIL